MRWVNLVIHFATPIKLSVVFGFLWTIAFYTLHFLDSAEKDSMSLLPAIFKLGYS